MIFRYGFLLIFLLLSNVFTKTLDGDIVFSYKKTQSLEDEKIKNIILKSSISRYIKNCITDKFYLKEDIKIEFGYENTPFYEPKLNTIYIPYAFYNEIKSRFLKHKDIQKKKEIKNAILDNLMYVIFHELAHAIISMYDLPIVSKEEDAADTLATILIIEYFENGQEIVLSAADLFNYESSENRKLKKDDFWDDHSLYIQRYHSTMCLVYGSNKEKYKYIKNDLDFGESRAAFCINEYSRLLLNWLKLLKEILKD